MLGAHKQEYVINGEKVTAVANFMSNRLHIYRQHGHSLQFALDVYEKFEGNMEDFLHYHLGRQE